MEDLDNLKTLKKIFSDRNVLYIFLISLLSLVVVLSAGLGFAWHFRAPIFNYFSENYLERITEPDSISANEKSTTLKIVEKQTVFREEQFVIDAVKRTNPAVVSITISKNVPKYETYTDPNQEQNPFGEMPPGFFFNIPQYRQNGTEKKEIGGGSGFFVSANGLVVTNKHVVNQKDVEYTVFTNDGKKHTAKVVARDPILDIALIKIDASNLPYLALGDSDSLQVGQSVIAIGNALAELRNTVSVGVVSGLARSVVAGDSFGKTELLDHVIQTDAAINLGNSGGPLLDLSGKVIGVNVAIAEGSQNVGFALPINSVKSAIESVKATGKIIRPYLGVRYVVINAEMKDKNNLSVDHGALVKAGQNQNELAVIPGSPADKAGIVENDIILQVDGRKLDDKNTLASVIRQKKVGNMVTLKILHRGEEKNIKVVLEAARDM